MYTRYKLYDLLSYNRLLLMRKPKRAKFRKADLCSPACPSTLISQMITFCVCVFVFFTTRAENRNFRNILLVRHPWRLCAKTISHTRFIYHHGTTVRYYFAKAGYKSRALYHGTSLLASTPFALHLSSQHHTSIHGQKSDTDGQTRLN